MLLEITYRLLVRKENSYLISDYRIARKWRLLVSGVRGEVLQQGLLFNTLV